MYFTSDDIKTIIKALEKRGYIGSLPLTTPVVAINGTLTDTIDRDTRILVGNDKGNFHIYAKDFVSCLSDFINIDNRYLVSKKSLEEVIPLILERYRKLGIVITFTNEEGKWEIYQYEGSTTEDTEWLVLNNWYKIK